MRSWHDVVYLIVRGSLRVFLRVWNRYEVTGLNHVPTSGGYLVAANHTSFLDPAAIACSTRKQKTFFLARDSLFFKNLTIFKMLRCIPLKRETGEVTAIRAALKILKQGEPVSLFPEGTRSPDGKLKEAKLGVGFLVAKAALPVVPALITGTFEAYPKGARWIRPCKIRITYGEPIWPPELEAFGKSREAHQEIGNLIMSRIAALTTG